MDKNAKSNEIWRHQNPKNIENVGKLILKFKIYYLIILIYSKENRKIYFGKLDAILRAGFWKYHAGVVPPP